MRDTHRVTRFAGIIADYAYVGRSRLGYWRYGSRPPAPIEAAPDAPPPVLLIPGVFETWHYMKPVRDRLVALGHPVHSVPELGFNRHPIPEMAALLAAYVAHRDLRSVRIVAHSKGGLIGKLLLVADAASTEVAGAEVAGTDAAGAEPARFDRMISINTPYSGSPLARFGFGPWREFAPTRRVMVELDEARHVNPRITSLYSEYDQYVPAGGAVLTDAEHVELPHVGHFRVLGLPDVIDEVIARLG